MEYLLDTHLFFLQVMWTLHILQIWMVYAWARWVRRLSFQQQSFSCSVICCSVSNTSDQHSQGNRQVEWIKGSLVLPLMQRRKFMKIYPSPFLSVPDCNHYIETALNKPRIDHIWNQNNKHHNYQVDIARILCTKYVSNIHMYFPEWVYYCNSFRGSHNQFVRESRSVSSAQSSTPIALGIAEARSMLRSFKHPNVES